MRGIWRSATLSDYAKPDPAWATVLDLDALAKSEQKNWVWHGADCDSPSGKRCMISLSEGGEDASTEREFDLRTGQFVADGFSFPRGKQAVAWVDDDTLLASREWVPGELTTSGYPYVVKRLKRGEPLSGGVEVFRGTTTDVSVDSAELRDGQGNRAVLINRGISFFETETHLVTPNATPKLNIPLKANPVALVAGHLLIKLDDDWNANGAAFAQGSLVSVDLSAAKTEPQHLKPTLVYAPGPRETLDGVRAMRNRAIVTTYQNVKGRAFVYTPSADGSWSKRRLQLPDDSTIAIASADEHGTNALLYVTSFLNPTSLWLADTSVSLL